MDSIRKLPWYGQFLVFFIIVAIALAVYYFTDYSTKEDSIKRLQNDIDQVEAEIKKAEQKQDKMNQIRDEIEAKEAVLERLKEILPIEKEIAQIIKNIQAILSEAKLNISTWTTLSPERQEVYTRHPIQIAVEGNYHNLGVFFDQLTKLKKIFLVNTLLITPYGQMTSEITVNANFIASTYTYVEPPSATAGKASRSGK